MKKFIEFLKKYRHDVMIVLGVVLIGVVAVMGEHWTGIAKHKFWWSFWDVAKWVCIIAWIAGWLYLKAKDKYSR